MNQGTESPRNSSLVALHDRTAHRRPNIPLAPPNHHFSHLLSYLPHRRLQL